MRNNYVKPSMINSNRIVEFIPAILALGMSVGSAIGAAASSSAALGGLAAGAAAGAAAGGVTALCKKKSGFDFTQENFIPSLDPVGIL